MTAFKVISMEKESLSRMKEAQVFVDIVKGGTSQKSFKTPHPDIVFKTRTRSKLQQQRSLMAIGLLLVLDRVFSF